LPIHTLLRNVTHGHHASPRELRVDLPAQLDAIIERAMSLRPKDRYRSTHELGRAIFPFASSEVQRQFDDYYRAEPAPLRSTPARKTAVTVPANDRTATEAQPGSARATWQARTTRTVVRAAGPGRASGSGWRSRKLVFSVAIGAVLAAVALGFLVLALRP
jgi:hypothetical protein